MQYVSTRGAQPPADFVQVLLRGLASDGGLFVPRHWPKLTQADISSMRGMSFSGQALKIMKPFVDGAIDDEGLQSCLREAYSSFSHPAICPLVQTDENEFILELFHGPTFAFKDIAMQVISRLMDHVLARSDRRTTIITATSGDTGAAAVHAFAGRNHCDLFVLFPKGRVSPSQQRQMTTSGADNVYPLEIEGDFDDCQDIVKTLFGDHAFAERQNLSGVNSINWARIMAQIPYYFSAAVSLGSPARPVSFCVPTGNFGDIYAGYVAKQMGLPIDRLVIATNDNDILARTLDTGRYERRTTVQTTSPSMDIQVSSNFERLLFETAGKNADFVKGAMGSLKQSGEFTVTEPALSNIRAGFDAGRADMAAVSEIMDRVYQGHGYMIDPHTASAVHVARKQPTSLTPMIILSTAHPAKFGDAVVAATGTEPDKPTTLKEMELRVEKLTSLPAQAYDVKAYIEENARSK